MRLFVSILYAIITLVVCHAEGSAPGGMWPHVTASVDSLNSVIERTAYENPRLLKPHIIELAGQSDIHPESDEIRAMAIYWEAYEHYSRSDLDGALYIINSATGNGHQVISEYTAGRLESLRLAINWHRSDVAGMYAGLKRLENYYDSIGDFSNMAFIYRLISFYLRETNNHNESFAYIVKADSIYKKAGLTVYEIKNQLNVATMLSLRGDTANSRRLFSALLKSKEAERDTLFYINLLISCNHAFDSPELKREFAERAYNLSRLTPNLLLKAKSEFIVGESLLREGDVKGAESLFKSATDYGLMAHNHSLLQETLRGLIETKCIRNQWDSAFYYQSALITSIDSLAIQARSIEIVKAEALKEKEEYEHQLVLASSRLYWQRVLIVIMLISATLIIAVLAFGIINYVKKNRLLKTLEELKQKEIDKQNRELANYALNISKKVDIINRVSTKIDELQRSDSITRRGAESLRNNINSEIEPEKNWVYLRLSFDKEHPGYIESLTRTYPALTEGEVRLCIYIYMGFSTKQMATMLSVMPDSIKTFRYRLRKKFALNKTDSLEDFIRGFCTNEN